MFLVYWEPSRTRESSACERLRFLCCCLPGALLALPEEPRTWVCRDLEQKEMRGALFPAPGLGAERPQPLQWGSEGAILLGQALPLEMESSFPASLAA